MIHEKLKNDETGEFKKSVLPYWNMEVDKLVTDAMTAASSNSLVKIA